MKRAIVLGGVSPHIALIKNLKDRGYKIVVLNFREPKKAAIGVCVVICVVAGVFLLGKHLFFFH